MRIRLFVAALSVLSASLTAHASSFTYNLLNVTLTNGVNGPADGSLSGTFTLNVVGSTATLTSATIVASHSSSSTGGYTYTYVSSAPGSSDSVLYGTTTPTYIGLTNNSGDQLMLEFQSALSGTTDQFSAGANEYESILGTRDVASGSVVPVAATPEPSAIALLGTGLLGIAGFARRRFV